MKKSFFEIGGKETFVIFQQKIPAKLCPAVMWKTELGSDELEYLAEEIFKQSIEGTSLFLLAACDKM